MATGARPIPQHGFHFLPQDGVTGAGGIEIGLALRAGRQCRGFKAEGGGQESLIGRG